MEEFQKYFFRPLFTIIFRPEMLKFHSYSILTGEEMVGFVIFSVLIDRKNFAKLLYPNITYDTLSRDHEQISFVIVFIKSQKLNYFLRKLLNLSIEISAPHFESDRRCCLFEIC